MYNDLSSYFEDPEFKEILAKYEGMAESHAPTYFDAEELTDIAEYYASQNREKEAEAAIDMALRLHPSNTDALVFKARSLAIRGKINEAYQIAALIEDPSDREVKFLKADLLMEEQRLEEAEAVYKELAESENYSTEVLMDITLAYLDTNQKEYAAKWFKILNEQGVNETNSQQYRDLWCDYCITFDEPAKAIKAYQLTLDEMPYSISHWNGLAKCYLMLDDMQQTHEAVDFALAIDENNQDALEVKGYCFMQDEEYKQAIGIYRRLMKTAKDKSRLYGPLTKCYLEEDRAQEALEVSLSWVKDCPQLTNYEKSEVYSYIAMCYTNLTLPEEGMKYIDASLSLNPFNRSAILQKGMLHLQMEQDDAAEELFQKAIALSPDDERVDTYYGITNCYFCLGRYEEVTQWCREIILHYPEEQVEALMMIADGYFSQHNMTDCIHYLALAWECEKSFDTPIWSDKRFSEMLQTVQSIINNPDFDLDKYI